MTIVSSTEFETNQSKFFDLAVSEDVCIKRGKYMFHLMCSSIDTIDEQKVLKSDDDLRRAITKDELLEGIYEDISKRFVKK